MDEFLIGLFLFLLSLIIFGNTVVYSQLVNQKESVEIKARR